MSSAPIKLVMDVRCTNEHADRPAYATVEITDELKARIEAAVQVCKTSGLWDARIGCSVLWAPIDGEAVRTECDLLEVHCMGSFCFTAYHRGCDYKFETESVDLSELPKLLAGVEPGGMAFASGGAEEFYNDFHEA